MNFLNAFRKIKESHVSKAIICSVAFLFLSACNPSTTYNYLAANGSDKKLPDDDGYTGGGGTGDGGGGQGILCSQSALPTNIKGRLFVRDIFEATFIAKRKMKEVPDYKSSALNKISKDEAKYLVEVLKSYFGHSLLYMEIGKTEYWNDFVSRISFIDDGAKLHPTQDANSPVILPAGCQIVQIAFWDDSESAGKDGILYVDKSYWDKLDSLNRLSLLAHEYFFKEARRAGYKNSDFIRAKIGKLFSEDGLEPLLTNWKPSTNDFQDEILPANLSGYKFCSGSIKGDSSSKLNMIYYNGNRLAIPILKSKRLTLSSLQPINLDVGTEVGDVLSLIQLKSHHSLSGPILTPKDEDQIDFWLRGSAINEMSDLKSAQVWLENLLKTIPKNTSVWSLRLEMPRDQIKLVLQSPLAVDRDSDSSPRTTAEEKILAIIEMHLRSTFPGSVVGASISSAPTLGSESHLKPKIPETIQVLLNRSVTILNDEINTHLSSGTNPENFPRWLSSVKNIAKEVVRPYSRAGVENYINRVQKYSTLLYKARRGTLSDDEKDHLSNAYDQIHPKLVTSADNIILRDGVLSIQDGSQKIEFQLSCEDAGVIYNEVVTSKIQSKIHSPRQTSELVFNMAEEKFTSEEKKKYSKILDLLSRNSGRSQTSYPIQDNEWKIYEEVRFFEPGSNAITFGSRLSHAKEIQVFPCSEFTPYLGQNLSFRNSLTTIAATNCLILNISEERSFFMIKVETPTEEIIDVGTKLVSYMVNVRPITPPEPRKLNDFEF